MQQLEQGLLVNRQVFGNHTTGEQLYEDTMGIQSGSTPRLAVRADDSVRRPDTSLYPAAKQVDVATRTVFHQTICLPDATNR